MKQFLSILAILCFSASAALAGPNAGGVLVVHDIGYTPYNDPPLTPVSTPPPADCASVDNERSFNTISIWKVYALFSPESRPRLKGVAWGEGISSIGGGGVYVLAGGLPNPASDFEVTQGGWPFADGGSIGQSFPSGAKLTAVTELYWFGGYAYDGPNGQPQFFCARPHAVAASVFVDDSSPPQTDPIAGYGCLGFGAPGSTPCPQPSSGACCFTNATCRVLSRTRCLALRGVFVGTPACSPNPCSGAGPLRKDKAPEGDPHVVSSWGQIKNIFR